ncbi:MAG: hypothetical protein VZQ83_00060 [Eubacterium sp.]|nr:hypothetical protein [Eubacterium sp.]
MIESIENIVQCVVLFSCLAIALYRGFGKDRTGGWTCLTFFFGSRLLGDIYWQMCLFYYGETPEIALISDLSWYASILFLYLLIRMEISGRTASRDGDTPSDRALWRRAIPVLGPIFTFAMAVFYMQWGAYVSNVIYAALMGLVLYTSLRGLLEKNHTNRWICMMACFFCLMEYGAWTASCFSDIDFFQYAYYGCDTLITISCPFYIPIISKEVIAVYDVH